jgi:Flp pilus assembly protein TadB
MKRKNLAFTRISLIVLVVLEVLVVLIVCIALGVLVVILIILVTIIRKVPKFNSNRQTPQTCMHLLYGRVHSGKSGRRYNKKRR